MSDGIPTATDRAPTANRPGSDGTPDGPGLSISAAAKRLGLSTDAVRSRLHRGTLAGVKIDDRWHVLIDQPTAPPTAERPGTDRVTTATDRATDGPATALIEHLEGEVAYLRAELSKRSDELARERERADVLQREALARIPALTAESSAASEIPEFGDSGHRRATFPPPSTPNTSQFDLDDFAGEGEYSLPGEINLEWSTLTDALIAELGMDPEAALIEAAAELGIDYGG